MRDVIGAKSRFYKDTKEKSNHRVKSLNGITALGPSINNLINMGEMDSSKHKMSTLPHKLIL